jgi:phosphoenolpyruvate-protein kinase (PTS system EI component)
MAAGELYLADASTTATAATPEEVTAAFSAVSEERSALASELKAGGRDSEADIVMIGALIAADPALVSPAVTAVSKGIDPVEAVLSSVAAQADLLAALPHPELASRADDVRQVGNSVVARLTGGLAAAPAGTDFILVMREVDPADLIRLADRGLAGAVSVSGGANSHAAIIARGLGVPMLAGADPAVLDLRAGHRAIIDGAAGVLTVDPEPEALALIGTGVRAGAVARTAGSALLTADGEEITLLCNVASAIETRRGLAAGAAGVGLLRTEIAFTGANDWPDEPAHSAALEPILSQLAGRPAVVRLLDFSGDKVPPFLADGPSGLTALLGHPRALGDQLRAIVRCGAGTKLAVMVPMVRHVDELAAVRTELQKAADQAGAEMPSLGMMVELAGTARSAGEFAAVSDFFSIGTNDLTSDVLGIDRADPKMRPALAADPRVLSLVATVVEAARTAGITVSVCGDAAADPVTLPLLAGLGVRRFSVGAAAVPGVAAWIAGADASAWGKP